MATYLHTPGPWTAGSDGEANFSGLATSKNWLARIQQNGELSTSEHDANTKLMAAAPDMLIVLIEAVDHAHVYDTNPALVELFKAVIAKATNN